MITIILFTCARPVEREEYAFRTLRSLYRLKADEEIWLHVADDGSEQRFRDEMMEEARLIFGDNTSITNSGGNGYGGSYNKASQVVHNISDILLPLEDDWEVVKEFDLSPFANALREGVFNCIRMGYIGYTDKLLGEFVYNNGNHYLRLDPDSPEKHVFTGGPRLETRDFERAIGEWPTDMNAGATELEVCGRKEARKGVAWPIGLIKPSGDLFVHMGTLKAETGVEGSKAVMAEVGE